MSRIDFYHLQKSGIEEVLPKLLEKAYASGKHIVVKIGTEDRVEFINTLLWTYDDASFLPHGSKKDGNAASQPVWLTSGDDNPNQASMLFLIDDAKISTDKLSDFERVFNIFDGASEESIKQARVFWKEAKSASHECHYWQQTASGSWEEKA